MASDTHLDRLQQLFNGQKERLTREPAPSLEERLNRLACLRDLVLENRETLQDSVAADFGAHHPRLVDLMETGPVVGRVNYFESHLEEWMTPRRVELGPEHGSSHGEVHQVPKGVMGNISPWNFPVESALVMCTDMLAAGNTVIVKPSELAPNTAQILEDAIGKKFEPEIMAVVQGDAELGAAFASMPWDHLTFTGSPGVGRLVARAAAENLVPTTLELGGKNPAVFAPDGVTEELVQRFLSFRTLKAGQVCTSPDYVMVARDQLEAWIELARGVWQRAYPRYVTHPDATGIINDMHFTRLVEILDEARRRGTRIIGLNDDEADAARRQLPVTLIVDPADDLTCMSEEIFGPIIPVVPYDSIEDALARINQGPSPLGAYIATHDEDLARRFVAKVRSGGAAVNNFGLQGGHVALPFGGFGRSGYGCHSARDGFLNYSHTKSVFFGAADSVVHKVLIPPISGSIDSGAASA